MIKNADAVKMLTGVLLIVLLANCSEDGIESSENALAQEVEIAHLLVAIDSIGVDQGDSAYVFGDIRGASITPNGSIALLDFSFQGIRFYSSNGIHMYDFAPQGEGPGEFLRMNRMDVNSSGNLFVSGTQDRKVVIFSSYLEMIREIQFQEYGRTWPVGIEAMADTSFILKTTVFSGSDSAGTEIALFRETSTPEVIYRRSMAHASENMNIQYLTGMTFAAAENGNVFISDYCSEVIQIVCYSQEGDSLFEFGKSGYEPVFKTDSILEEMESRALRDHLAYHGSEEGFNYDPPRHYLPVLTMEVDSLDRLWVRGERDYTTADVFSNNGEYLFSVESCLPEWQEVQQWNFSTSERGTLAIPRNPELYPLVYMMKEVETTL